MKKIAFSIVILFTSISCMASSLTLHDAHAKLDCVSCHVSDNPVESTRAPSEKCIACHGDLKQVSESIKSKKTIDPDPHWNHMIDLACSECHKEHRPGVNMCARCHNLEFAVP